MFEMLAMGALSFGGSLLSGFGKKQSSAKQARLQAIADEKARLANLEILRDVNAKKEALAKELLTVPQTTDTQRYVDVDAMMAAGKRAGFNPVTWLNSGAIASYTQERSTSVGHNAAAAYSMMVPEYSLVQASQVPQQYSNMEAFGGAITSGANMLSTMYGYDSKTSATDKLIATLAKGGLSYANSITGGGVGSGSVVTNGGAASVSGGMSMNKTNKDGTWPNWDLGFPDVTSFSPLWQVDKKSPDAQAVEDRYHEVGGLIGGVFNIANDANLYFRGQPVYKEPWFQTTVKEAKAVSSTWDNVPVWLESKGLYPWKTFYGNAGSAAP